MRRLLFALAALLAPLTAQADYIAPPLTELVKEATAIVDATVTAIDAQGHATLKVHATWAGTAPARLTSVRYSCFGALKVVGLSAGTRAVFVLRGEEIQEEQTWYRVRAGAAGLEVEQPPLDGTYVWPRPWAPYAEIKAQMLAARG